jgi:clathrin heavy chain
MKILRSMIPINPQAALKLAQMISVRDASGQPKTPLEGIVTVFLEFHKVQETTAFLLEALKGNLPHEGHL